MIIAPGYRVGRLTVESDSGERKNGYVVWNCTCDCGNEMKVDRRTLLRGTVRDCGCVTKLRPGQRDITGERFGMLTARYCTGKKDRGGSYLWHCSCDCGGEVDASLHKLQSGDRKSCGSLSRPAVRDFVGRRFGRLTVKEYAGKEAGMYRWRCVCDCGRETVVGQTLLLSGKTKSCGCIRQDVMRQNLKLTDGTSVTILKRNRTQLTRTNTSGKAGVYYNKAAGCWIAQLGFKGKRIYLGSYQEKQDAVRARDRAEEEVDDFLAAYEEETLHAKSVERINIKTSLIEKMEGKS